MVNAICTLHFLRKLLDAKKLNIFFQTQVNERYLKSTHRGWTHRLLPPMLPLKPQVISGFVLVLRSSFPRMSP